MRDERDLTASVTEIEALDFDDRVALIDFEAQNRRDLAVAQNVAENGRWMCAFGFLLCIVLFNSSDDAAFAFYALLFVVTLGLSCLVDLVRHERVRAALALLAYAIPSVVLALLLVKLW